MSFSDILFPRNEIIKGDGIQGIIDIENLNNKKYKTIEASPSAFFDLTFPTTDIKSVLEHLNERFDSVHQTPGLFLLEGLKGSGKSHLELLIYHLFKNPSIAREWLANNNLTCTLPDDAIVIIHKFTDFPLDAIWNLIFEKVGAKEYLSDKRPNLDQLRDAIKGKKIILIMDELELGYASISDKNMQAQNLSFLQMLSEEAQRSENTSITVVTSIYNSNNEPGSTLKRVPRIDIKFSESQDRKMVILHRLFSNYLKHDKKKVENSVQSYINQWRKTGIHLDEKYVDRFIESYPFTPELMDIILNRVLNRNFQGNRGPLGLLGRVIKNNHQKVDVISTSHLNITDTAIRNYLADLDPGQKLIQCALNDLKDLEQTPLANEIVSSALLASITSTGNVKGIKEQELARQVIRPGDNFNDYIRALNSFVQFGTYFQHAEDAYFFDTTEKPYSKVEYKSLLIDPKNSLNFALDRFRKNVFNDTDTIVYREDSQVKNDLFQKDKNSLRYVLSPKRLVDDERKKIYSGIENPNTVLLLEPRTETFNALNNHDIVKWGQLSLAAFDLKNNTSDTERKRQYEKIELDNARYIDETFRKAGLMFVLVTKTSAGLSFELENIGSAISKTDVFEQLKRNVFPSQRIEEHLFGVIESAAGKSNWVLNQTVSEVKTAYRKNLGFPVLLTHLFLIDAIKKLCTDKTIGLTHPRERFCGRYPTYSESEWNEAVIVEPFPDDEIDDTTRKPVKPSIKNEPAKDDTVIVEIVSDDFEPVNIFTTNVNSLISLRQDIAARLSGYENFSVNRVRFTIFLEQADADLGTYPSAFRGQLTGISNIHVELVITKTGNFTKAQLEQMAEQLTVLQGATYKAEIKGVNKLNGVSANV